jgi:chromosome segregation ATPase
MQAAIRAVVAIAILNPLTPQAVAQPRAKIDPDWPCQQIKTPTFSLASVWTGPQLDLDSQTWRNESDVSDLKAKMAQRRVPIADAESAIKDFKAKAGADANAKLLRAFAAAFQDLSEQRSQVIEGLDRFGRKQNALADRIRTENEAVQTSSDQKSDTQTPPGASSQDKLLWDIRVYNDRHQTASYVCEVPTLIEQRIGEIARAVQNVL